MANRVEITSLAVDVDRQELFYSYRLLNEQDVVIQETGFSLTDEEYAQAQSIINGVLIDSVTAQIDSGQPISIDVFSLIEAALEAGANQRLGLA